jgi:hypothetical protein
VFIQAEIKKAIRNANGFQYTRKIVTLDLIS